MLSIPDTALGVVPKFRESAPDEKIGKRERMTRPAAAGNAQIKKTKLVSKK